MSKRDTIVIVNPEGYGLGLLLGCFLRLWPLFLAIAVVILAFVGFSRLGQLASSSITSNQIEIEAKGKFQSLDEGFIVFYTLQNKSAKAIDLMLGIELPVTFHNCTNGEGETVNFQKYMIYHSSPAIQTRLEPYETQSGSVNVISVPLKSRGMGFYMCVGDYSCEGYPLNHECKSYDIQKPKFFIWRASGDVSEINVTLLP